MDEEKFTPYNELCHFADYYKYHILIEKPFEEFDELYLVVLDENKEVIAREILNNIFFVDEISAKLLNELSKKTT